MRFKTHENLIDLLVGQSLYSSPLVAMRELLQNAEDACYLQSIVDPSFKPAIRVRYSVKENWVEIRDNGLGMDEEVFENSFTTVGASKTLSPQLQQIIEKAGGSTRPIGQFGIGILSCFGVAEVIEVYSKAEDKASLAFAIRNLHSEFDPIPPKQDERGTTLLLKLKEGGPMRAEQVPEAVSNFVRHALHITIDDADSGISQLVPERWLLADWQGSAMINHPSLISGYLQLSDAWDNITQGFDSHLVLCNAGFLVNDSATGVLPQWAVGFRSELNVKPDALTILMNREGFKADDHWATFVNALTAHYRQLVSQKIEDWLLLDLQGISMEQRRAIQRAVLLILRSGMRDVVGPDIVIKAYKLLPSVLIIAENKVPNLSSMLAEAKKNPPLYVQFADQPQRQVQRSFSEGGQNYTLTETVSSVDLRVSLLRANGYVVLRGERHDYGLNFGKTSHSIQIHDFDVLTEYCAPLEIPVQRVEDAPDAHTRIGSSPDAEALSKFMLHSSNLKIQSVSSMTDAIIADYNGYILNTENPDVRRILEIAPDAVGNPIRKQLLEAYFLLFTYEFWKAREIIFKLAVDVDFESKSRQTTGIFFRDYLRTRVKRLLETSEKKNG